MVEFGANILGAVGTDTLCLLLKNFFFVFCLFGTTPAAYVGSQARDLIGAIAAGLCQSHSNARSEPCLQPTTQLTLMPDP